MTDDEVFARLIFYGTTLLGREESEVWLMPLGHLLDQWEVYKQYNGMAKKKTSRTIDDIFPPGM